MEILRENGFAAVETGLQTEADIANAVTTLALSLGEIVPGRFGRSLEPVVPQSVDAALPTSLSAKFGLGALPFHTDTAHRLNPARYMIIGCVDRGRNAAATELCDATGLEWTSAELDLLQTAIFFVRTGRHSFYSTILNRRRPFVRYDEGCMEPTDQSSEEAGRLFRERSAGAESVKCEWQEGLILVVDNWRMLHARGAAQAATRRRLLRTCVR